MKPILQISIDLPDLDEAVKRVEDAISDNGVDLIAIGKKLVKNQGLRAVKEFKERFPDKRIIVDMDVLGRSRKLKSVVDAGADVLLITGDAPEEAIKNFIKEFKKKGVQIMVDLTKVKSPAESSKKLQDADTDYMLVDLDNLKEVSNSVITPIAVTIDSNEKNVAEAIEHGAQIIALSESITTAENIKEIIAEINEMLSEKPYEYDRGMLIEDEYIETVTQDLDNIKNILMNLEAQRKVDDENKLLMKKDLDEMETRFKNIMKIEQDRIDEERKVLKKQMGKIEEGWQKLREGEARLEEKRKTLDIENQIRWKEMLQEFEEEMKKRISEHKIREGEEMGEKALDVKIELEGIRNEWEEMEGDWRKIDEDKKEIDEKRGKLEEEWTKIEEIKKRGTEVPEEEEEIEEDERIEDELGEIEREWIEIENVWRKIDEDKKDIEEKRKRLEDEWMYIEKTKKEIERDQETIKAQLKEIEEMKTLSISNHPELVSSINQVEEIHEDREELDKKRRDLEETERRIDTKRAELVEEIKKLEEEWLKIKEIRKDWDVEEEIKKTAGKAIADLQRLKKEHEKEKPEKKEELADEKTKETINRLIDLINERGEIKLKDAAKELHMHEYLLKRWSSILEKRQIIEVKAPLLGDVILKRGVKINKLTSSE